MVLQTKDPNFKKLIDKLEKQDDPQYELRNGLVYKKQGSQLLFVVPKQMESHVLYRYHNELGHCGLGKMLEALKATYFQIVNRDVRST